MKLFSYPKQVNILTRRNLNFAKVRNWYANLIKPKPIYPPYFHITQIGDPVLRTVAEEIPKDLIKSPEIQFLIKLMKNVFKRYNCVGLSAAQVGLSYKIFIMEFSEEHAKSFSQEDYRIKEMSLMPFKVVINPEVKITDFSKIVFSESCESVRGFTADVPRYRALKLRGFDENNEEFEVELNGWNARIVQHEMDHLNGKLYTDIMDRKSLSCSCWQVVNERGGRVHMPFKPD